MQQKLIGGSGEIIPHHPFGRATLTDLLPKLRSGTYGPRGPLVLLRVDWNVSDEKTGQIKDDTRIEASAETLRWLVALGARVILISHNGRPNGIEPKLSLGPVIERARLLIHDVPFEFAGDLGWGPNKQKARAQKPGTVLVLENTRFDARDEAGNITWVSDLYGQIGVPNFVVLDGFAAMHREHASVTGIARYASDRGRQVVMGRLVEKELRAFEPVITSPPRRFVAVVGGAKVSGDSGKLNMIKGLLKRADAVVIGGADAIVIGGAMVWAFLAEMGYNVGKYPLHWDPAKNEPEADRAAVRALMPAIRDGRIVIPMKVVVGNAAGEIRIVDFDRLESVPAGYKIRDIDSNAITKALHDLRTSLGGAPSLVLWNGPMGKFEVEAQDPDSGYVDGTRALIGYLAYVTSEGGKTVVGGGDSLKALQLLADPADVFSHLSTGGGASLELIERGSLPGIEVLTKMG